MKPSPSANPTDALMETGHEVALRAFPRVRRHARSVATLRGSLVLAVLALALGGCVSNIDDSDDGALHESPSLHAAAARTKTPPPGGSYRVVKGDTLYSISFKRGLDYHDVAAWNGIAAPQYKILVNQLIRFSPPGAVTTAPAEPRVIAAVPVAPASTAPAPAAAPEKSAPAPAAKDTGLFEDVPSTPTSPSPAQTTAAASASSTSTPPSVTTTSPEPIPAPAPSAAASVVTAPPVKPAAEPAPATKAAHEDATATSGGVAWRWPNRGKQVGGFVVGDQTRQGIDIAGAAGDPVLAAADGDVVYSGNGLLGYGELIIVKHNDTYLSAYGHNRKRLVAEGDKVHAGQQIAEMGSSGASRDELHFEIRKNGKPVNPLDYLPAR